jgi:cytidylate kinase
MSARVICISRAIWTGAEAIAADIAKELGFRHIDEEIINLAAEKRNISPAEVANAERRKSFLAQFVEDVARGGGAELLNYIPNHRTVPVGSEDLRALIREAVRETANQGNVVIVAHAASYALGRRDDVLRVLVTGSPFMRASRWLKTSGGKSPEEAAETIADSDKARANYLKRFYDIDREMPEDYDLCISTDVLTPAQAAELILKAARAIGT